MVSRIRTVKPDLIKHEELFELEKQSGLPVRIAFVGLFTVADREGRFKWRPRTLKLDVLPHDEIDFSRVLDALRTRGFIQKYAIDGEEYGVILTFKKHQVINNREAQSDLPAPPENVKESDTSTREPRVNHASPTPLEHAQGEGKGREGKGIGREGKEDTDIRGTRLPKNWHPSLEDTLFCKNERPDLRPSEVAQRFFDHWISKPGKDGRKLDWSATWRNWVRNEKRLAPSGGALPNKFDLSGADHTSTKAAAQASAEQHGVVTPEDGDVPFGE